MGTISEIRIDTRVRPDKIEECRNAIREKIGTTEVEWTPWYNSLRRILVDVEVRDDGSIATEEILGKWYAHEQFAKFLKRFVTKGRLTFHSQEGDDWGYQFDGRGGLASLIF